MQKISLILFFLFSSYFIYAQKEINGIVTDQSTGESLPAVSVMIKGTSVGSQTEVDVALVVEETGLGEIVVVGYGTQQKSDLTGAISSIDIV